MPVLETRDLTVRFGGHVAVDHVSCSFEPDTLTAIVGPNGAGKTTYFNLVSGQLRATEGVVIFKGEDVTALKPDKRTRRGMGRAFQLTNLFPNLSVFENVRLAVQARRGGRVDLFSMASSHQDLADKALDYLARVSLSDKAAMTAASLSHGDQRKLEVALLLAVEPDVFMFDEPTAGMSVDEAPVILDLIESIKQEHGKTILLVEHKMDVVRRLADRVIVLHNGKLAADGDPAEVVASPIVQEAYLGIRQSGAPHG